jgi:hypothetical protein
VSVDVDELTWEDLVEEDDDDPGYENFARIDFNLWTKDAGVLRAVSDLIGGIEGHKKLNQSCMMVLLLNLYRCWLVDSEKWMAYMRRKGSYRLCRKYNKNEVTWTGLVRCVDHLKALGSIDHALGFFYRGVKIEKGKCSRTRFRDEFAFRLEDEYGFTDNVIRRHPDEQIIILKDINKVPIEYSDTNHNDAAGKRRLLKKYNDCIEHTYIDLDKGDYKGKEPMWVDLSRKHSYRVYSNGRKSMDHGGRFYGAWWQGIPSELRLRIIINNMKVVECDYSGIHIYLLYAKEGVDFNALGKDSYQLPEYEPSKEMRNFFKILLLAALNADNPTSAKRALTRKFTKTPYKFPADKPNLDDAIKHFSNYHKPIAHHFFKGVGHSLMNTDSKIAEYVIKRMTDNSIPVLSVHDSFICPKIYEFELMDAMRDAFSAHCGFSIDKAITYYKIKESPNQRARPSRTPRIKIKHEEQGTNEDLGDYADNYMYDLLSIKDSDLINRMIRYDKYDEVTKYAGVTVQSRNLADSMLVN